MNDNYEMTKGVVYVPRQKEQREIAPKRSIIDTLSQIVDNSIFDEKGVIESSISKFVGTKRSRYAG